MRPEAKVAKYPWKKSFGSLHRGSDFCRMRKELMAIVGKTGGCTGWGRDPGSRRHREGSLPWKFWLYVARVYIGRIDIGLVGEWGSEVNVGISSGWFFHTLSGVWNNRKLLKVFMIWSSIIRFVFLNDHSGGRETHDLEKVEIGGWRPVRRLHFLN